MLQRFCPLLVGLLLLNLVFAPALVCAEGTVPSPLTLAVAAQRALEHHPDLQLAQHRRQAASVDLDAARGQFLPSLDASASAAGHLAQQAPPGATQDYRSASIGLSSRLNLFNGFADSASYAAALRQLDAADAELLRQRQTTLYGVASRFIAVVTAGELVAVAQESLSREQALLEQIEAFYQAGVRSVTDLYRQQAATAQAELALLSARRDRQVAELELLQAMGEEPPATLTLSAPEPLALSEQLGDPDLDATLTQAMTLRPDLRAQQQRNSAAEEQLRATRGGYLPSIDLYAEAATGYSSLSSGRDFGTQLSRDRGNATLGVSLNLPIFDRNVTSSSVAQARIGLSEATATLASLRQQIGVEVGSAVADYRTARLQLQVAQTQLTYARQALEAAEARYRVGAATWVDLADARATDTGARADLVRARQGVLQQGLALGYARGDLELLLARLLEEELP